MSSINYSGQYLDNHSFKIKIRTGETIENVTGDCVAGEMLLTTGSNKALYIAASTSTDDYFEIYKIADLPESDKII